MIGAMVQQQIAFFDERFNYFNTKPNRGQWPMFPQLKLLCLVFFDTCALLVLTM